MSIPEILLIALLFSGFFGFGVFALIDQWKRTQAYNGVMEALQESIVNIADNLNIISFEMTAARLKDKKHENNKDS